MKILGKRWAGCEAALNKYQRWPFYEIILNNLHPYALQCLPEELKKKKGGGVMQSTLAKGIFY